MKKTIVSATPTTYTNAEGVTTELTHVIFSDGSEEKVLKDSVFDPLSPNYNAEIDTR